MEINMKKKYLHRILIFFILLLFAIGLTMNMLFCSNYNLYKLLSKAAVIETRTISERMISNKDGDDTAHFRAIFLSKNNSQTETITNNICSIPMIAAIPIGFSLLLFLVIVFLYYFSGLFILLPDEWTLINQKVRLND